MSQKRRKQTAGLRLNFTEARQALAHLQSTPIQLWVSRRLPSISRNRWAHHPVPRCATFLHLADAKPHAHEDRWIDTTVVPQAISEPFDQISGNEWLLRHAPYTHGEIAFSAAEATADEAALLACAPGSALFVIDRITWDHAQAVTAVRLVYAPGHRMRTGL